MIASNEQPAYEVREELARLLTRLTQTSTQSPEEGIVRRLLDEAMRAWPGTVADLWWKWLLEAGTSLGLRVKVVELTAREALAMVEDGGQVATFFPHAAQSFLTLLACHGRQVHILPLEPERDYDVLDTGKLIETLDTARSLSPDGKIPWIIVDSQRIEQVDAAAQSPFAHDAGGGHQGGDHGGHHPLLEPLPRLMAILRPEWNDLGVVLVFAAFVAVLSLATPIAVESLFDTVAFGQLLQPVIVLATLLLVFLVFLGALVGVQTYIVEILQRRLFVRVAADLTYRLTRVRKDALDSRYGPEAVNRFFDVVTLQKVCASLLLDAVSIVLGAAAGMAILASYSPWLLGFDVLLIVLLVSSVWLLGRGAVKTSIRESQTKYRVAGWLEDIARCPTAFKLDGGPDFCAARTNSLATQYLEARRQHFRKLFRQILFLLGLQAVAATVLLGFGGWLVIRNQLTLGQLVAAELIVALILSSLVRMAKHLDGFYDLMAAVDELGELFDLPLERGDGLLHIDARGGAAFQLHDVSYHFRRGASAMHGLHLEVGSGERVGVVGPPGAGKSTLLDLLFGLRPPEEGYLEIDGVDARDVRPDVLRSHVVLVRQPEVFEGTVAENVHLNRVGISIGDVRRTLDELGVLNAVLTLPQGLDTPLTSSGCPLTGSQMRLITLARALVGRPRLVLIDGLLDALADGMLERVLSVLFAPERSYTLVVVSGRERILQRCDRRIDLPGEAATGQGQAVPVVVDLPQCDPGSDSRMDGGHHD